MRVCTRSESHMLAQLAPSKSDGCVWRACRPLPARSTQTWLVASSRQMPLAVWASRQGRSWMQVLHTSSSLRDHRDLRSSPCGGCHLFPLGRKARWPACWTPSDNFSQRHTRCRCAGCARVHRLTAPATQALPLNAAPAARRGAARGPRRVWQKNSVLRGCRARGRRAAAPLRVPLCRRQRPDHCDQLPNIRR